MSNSESNQTASAKNFFVKYALVLAGIDAVLSILIATFYATVLNAGGGVIGADSTATTVATVIGWILTAVFSFFGIGFFMFVASFIGFIFLALLFGGKGAKSKSTDDETETASEE